MLLGYPNEEINFTTYGDYLAAMDKVKKGNKMTREEAIIKYYTIMYGSELVNDQKMEWANMELSRKTIEAIEALGLIKFDDKVKKPEQKKYIFFPNTSPGGYNVSVYIEDAIKTFKEYGYKVEKVEQKPKELSAIQMLSVYVGDQKASHIIQHLETSGYRIVKLGKMTTVETHKDIYNMMVINIKQEQS